MDLLSCLDTPYLNPRTGEAFRAASVIKNGGRVTLYMTGPVSLMPGDVLLPLNGGTPLQVKKAPGKPVRGSALNVTTAECEKGEA